MHNLSKILIVSCASLLAVGCAKKAENISAAYVSPLTYEQYDCQQLIAEASRISARAAEVTGAQNKKAQSDAVATGVGIVLFWPALFLIKGGSETESVLSRLKGEKEAVEKVLIQKKCGVSFQTEA